MALLPPNSSNDLPSLPATATATDLPMRVDPVAETSATRLSSAIHFPVSASPITKQDTPSGTLFFAKTSAIIFWQATADKGVFSDGFQIHTSPQTHASIVFQAHTATGKLNAEMMPTSPNG